MTAQSFTMKKSCLLFIFSLLLIAKQYGQTTTTTTSRLSAKDSMRILKELMDLLDSADKPTSYVLANIGIGNRLFSVHNNSLNAKQPENKMIYSPSIAYIHKSGFGLTSAAYLLNNGGLNVNQYSISPSYELTGNKEFNFGVSYSRYFVKDKFSVYSSPIQNDFFTSFAYKERWLQPGMAVGYSSGEFKEIIKKDTSITNNIHRRLYDSITYKLNTFSLIFTLGHSYDWYNIFGKQDGIKLTHTLMANAGSSTTMITHKTNARYLYNILNKRGKIPKLQTEKFRMQSIGLDVDVYYSVANFIFEPQFYLDYYLPSTNQKRLSQVLTLNIGYTF